MGEVFHFEGEYAKEYGIVEAVILQNLIFWIKKNKANERHFYEGKYWTYNSIRAFHELFNFLTPKQIRRALESLEESEAVIKNNFNKSSYDRTTWYTVSDEIYTKSIDNSHLPKQANGVLPNGQMDLPETANGFAQADKCHLPKQANGNAQAGEPIPDINTDIKPEKEKSQSVYQSNQQKEISNEKTTDGLTEHYLKELERMLQNGQVYLYQARLFIESVIKRLYTDGQMPYILKMGLTHTEIQDRLRLLNNTHIDAALAKMRNVKTNKELYFAKCLLTAIVEVDIDEIVATAVENDMESVAPNKKPPPYGPAKLSQMDNVEQREDTDEFLESFYANVENRPPTVSPSEQVIATYEKTIGHMNPEVAETIDDWLASGVEADLLCRYIDEARCCNMPTWAYVNAMIKGNLAKNIRTLEHYEAFKHERKQYRTETVRDACVCRETEEVALPHPIFAVAELPVCEVYPNPFVDTPVLELEEQTKWRGEPDVDGDFTQQLEQVYVPSKKH